NIDGLERKAGLSVWDPYAQKGSQDYVSWQAAQSVPLHGSMEYLVCQLCASSFSFSEKPGKGAMSAGDACPDCLARSDARVAHGRRTLPSGKLRPTVVLYEEPHPHCEDIARIISHDARTLASRREQKATNVVLIFGTTLKVPGCRQLVKKLATASSDNTITVLVNNEPVCGKSWDGVVDYQIIGNVEDWCRKIENQWNAQTKITRWTKTRKRNDTYTESKANKENPPPNASKREVTGKKRKATPPANTDIENMDVYVDIVTIDTNELDQSEPRAIKKHKKTRICDSINIPARRSLRIAEKRSLEEIGGVTVHHSQMSISICT
ncbi:NAD-dependent deacetylase hst3, partial [Coemansia sp. RSA 2607]